MRRVISNSSNLPIRTRAQERLLTSSAHSRTWTVRFLLEGCVERKDMSTPGVSSVADMRCHSPSAARGSKHA